VHAADCNARAAAEGMHRDARRSMRLAVYEKPSGSLSLAGVFFLSVFVRCFAMVIQLSTHEV